MSRRGQSKRASIIEAVINTFSGFIISLIVWHWLCRWYAIPMPFSTNLEITSVFTVVSIVRSYFWRRIFNWFMERFS